MPDRRELGRSGGRAGGQEQACTEEYTGREISILNCVFTTFYRRLGFGITIQSAHHHFGIGFGISERSICLGWISDSSRSRRTALDKYIYIYGIEYVCVPAHRRLMLLASSLLPYQTW